VDLSYDQNITAETNSKFSGEISTFPFFLCWMTLNQLQSMKRLDDGHLSLEQYF
jgi:hypothetical protein